MKFEQKRCRRLLKIDNQMSEFSSSDVGQNRIAQWYLIEIMNTGNMFFCRCIFLTLPLQMDVFLPCF